MYKEGIGNIPNKDKVRNMLDTAFKNNPGDWIIHSHIIGKTSEKIAKEIGACSCVAGLPFQGKVNTLKPRFAREKKKAAF